MKMHNPLSFGHWRPVLVRQPPGVSDVALTFDDGPTPETTPKLLRILEDAGAKATFFLSGIRIAAYPQLAADIVAAGHAAYGHAWEHENLERATAARAISSMQKVEEALARLRPTPSPYLLRLPYNAGFNCSWMHRAMARFHSDVRFAFCTLNPRDYALANDCPDLSTLAIRCQAAARRLCSHPSLPGSIVLLHENPFDVVAKLAPYIAELLVPAILEGIAARGLATGFIQVPSSRRALDRFLLLAATHRPFHEYQRRAMA
ncbi:MAG: polysaccharide deacetylase family protein [Acetobacteraceae bacterium]|nr:polysaccharide deacetylase family protein [Acetobacteraceae bacterium]